MRAIKTCFTLASLLIVSHVFAYETAEKHATQKALFKQCSTAAKDFSQAKSNACYDYIDGFLSGAVLFDELMLSHLKQEHSHGKLSEFFQRAHRTRVGSAVVDPSDYIIAPFCLPKTASHDPVIAEILNQLPNTINDKHTLNESITNTLINNYPCKNS